MQFCNKPQEIWYHGSNKVFAILEEGSSITQWRELAEAFSINQQYLLLMMTIPFITMERNMAIYILWTNLLKLIKIFMHTLEQLWIKIWSF